MKQGGNCDTRSGIYAEYGESEGKKNAALSAEQISMSFVYIEFIEDRVISI